MASNMQHSMPPPIGSMIQQQQQQQGVHPHSAGMIPNFGGMQHMFAAQQQHIAQLPPPQFCCKQCHFDGCDIQVLDCGCHFHAVRSNTLSFPSSSNPQALRD